MGASVNVLEVLESLVVGQAATKVAAFKFADTRELAMPRAALEMSPS